MRRIQWIIIVIVANVLTEVDCYFKRVVWDGLIGCLIPEDR
jgi:hypothetical protein